MVIGIYGGNTGLVRFFGYFPIWIIFGITGFTVYGSACYIAAAIIGITGGDSVTVSLCPDVAYCIIGVAGSSSETICNRGD